MPNLIQYPYFQLKPRQSYRSRFILRIEEHIPSTMDGREVELIKSTILDLKNVHLSLLSTEKRDLAYQIIFKQKGSLPRVVHTPWYVFAFYGTKISTVQVAYQDANIRVVKGGNGNYAGLIVRRKDMTKPTEEIPEESSD